MWRLDPKLKVKTADRRKNTERNPKVSTPNNFSSILISTVSSDDGAELDLTGVFSDSLHVQTF